MLDPPAALILFAEASGAQTALLLDHGSVCGGALRVRALDAARDLALVQALCARVNARAAGDL